MKLRNLLFAPADAPRKIEKALASTADGVILDLEDSVAPAAKEGARDIVRQTLAEADRSRVIVRVNPADTRWYLGDLAAVASAGPAAILLPKCAGPHDLARIDSQLDVLEVAAGLPVGGIKLLALVTETVASLKAMDYAGVTPRLVALCFGAEDLSADLGIVPRDATRAYPAPVSAARAATLNAAGQAGVAAVDTPWPDPRDPEGLAAEAAAAATDGFQGKLCIHPGQLDAVAAAFTPAPERLQWARTVRQMFADNPGAGVLSLDGKMLDQPHLKLATRLLAAVGE